MVLLWRLKYGLMVDESERERNRTLHKIKKNIKWNGIELKPVTVRALTFPLVLRLLLLTYNVYVHTANDQVLGNKASFSLSLPHTHTLTLTNWRQTNILARFYSLQARFHFPRCLRASHFSNFYTLSLLCCSHAPIHIHTYTQPQSTQKSIT